MTDICVVHSSKDRPKAKSVAEALTRIGWTVYCPKYGFYSKLLVFYGTFQAKCVLILWSSTSAQLEDMARIGHARGVLVAATLEHVKVLPEFEAIPTVDLTNWNGDFRAPDFQPLVGIVRTCVQTGKSPISYTVEPQDLTTPSARSGPLQTDLSIAPTSRAFVRPASPAEPDSASPSRTTGSQSEMRSGLGLFLSYRHDDTQDAAGRLRDHLAGKYGAGRVFMDIDSVPLGIDFVDHVAEQISKCSVVIVMIGRQWLSIQDRRGRKRLEAEDDLVRAEVAAALKQNIPVIPVFVQDAEMPHADDLPENIRPLARRNGIELSATRWRTDVERLIKELDRVMKALQA